MLGSRKEKAMSPIPCAVTMLAFVPETLDQIGNEGKRHKPIVRVPVLAILLAAPLEVSAAPVGEDEEEEERVEIRDCRIYSCNQSPAQALNPVGCWIGQENESCRCQCMVRESV